MILTLLGFILERVKCQVNFSAKNILYIFKTIFKTKRPKVVERYESNF